MNEKFDPPRSEGVEYRYRHPLITVQFFYSLGPPQIPVQYSVIEYRCRNPLITMQFLRFRTPQNILSLSRPLCCTQDEPESFGTLIEL